MLSIRLPLIIFYSLPVLVIVFVEIERSLFVSFEMLNHMGEIIIS